MNEKSRGQTFFNLQGRGVLTGTAAPCFFLEDIKCQEYEI